MKGKAIEVDHVDGPSSLFALSTFFSGMCLSL